MVQNIFMYFDSVVMNLLILLIFGSSSISGNADQPDDWVSAFGSIWKPLVICIMINNSTVG